MIPTKHNATEYEFTKDLAAHIVFAEVKHFAREMNTNGPSEDEIQSLTRRLAYLVDRDLNWCEIDQLVTWAKELDTANNGALLAEMFWEINSVLGACRIRYEKAVA